MDMEISKRNVFIVFSDLKGFSSMTAHEKEVYLRDHLVSLSSRITESLQKAITYNTWGDAIVAIFDEGIDAVEFMLEYRNFAPELKSANEEKKIIPRIAGHYGEVNLFNDPLLGKMNMLGVEMNTAARIEPVTRPGEVFVTKEFKESFEREQLLVKSVDFDELGLIPLAKDFGEKELFRLRRFEEKPQIIDTLFKQQIESALPKEPKITASEQLILDELKKSGDKQSIRLQLEEHLHTEKTGAFCVESAKLCKKAGLYKEGLDWIGKAQASFVETSGIRFYPYQSKKQVIQLHADLLTRQNKYVEAANLLYSLWRNIEDEKSKDASEILAMLAAQLKRRAMMNGNEPLSRAELDRQMLEKAANLYLEAFRINIAEYYPAINAAYLQVMMGGEWEESGKDLAQYILTVWSKDKGKSHWLDFTLAECLLLEGKFEEAAAELDAAIDKHIGTLGVFDIEATKIQILQYLKVMDLQERGSNIISILDTALIRIQNTLSPTGGSK